MKVKNRLEEVKRQFAITEKRLDEVTKKDIMKRLEEVKLQTALTQKRLDEVTRNVAEVKKSTTELLSCS